MGWQTGLLAKISVQTVEISASQARKISHKCASLFTAELACLTRIMLFQPFFFGCSRIKMFSCSCSSRNTQVLTMTAKKNTSNIFKGAVCLFVKFHALMVT